uniref:Transmembrane protein n=1 Tax=Cacopsylla melanoneura TaxID=428564 RepID=A0A8D8V9I2_9HEMI
MEVVKNNNKKNLNKGHRGLHNEYHSQNKFSFLFFSSLLSSPLLFSSLLSSLFSPLLSLSPLSCLYLSPHYYLSGVATVSPPLLFFCLCRVVFCPRLSSGPVSPALLPHLFSSYRFLSLSGPRHW